MDTPQFHINLLPDIVRAFDSHEELEALCGYTRVLDAELHDRLVEENAPTCEQCQELADAEMKRGGLSVLRLPAQKVTQLRQEYHQRVLGYTFKFSYSTGTRGTRPSTRFDFPLAG